MTLVKDGKKKVTFGGWVKEGAMGTIRNRTVGTMTNLLFDATAGKWFDKALNSIFPKPEPGYMIELRAIQDKLNVMDEKLNSLIGYSEQIISEINKTYQFIIKDTILETLDQKNSLPYAIGQKYQRLEGLDAFNLEYEADDLWAFVNSIGKKAADGSWVFTNEERSLMLEMGGSFAGINASDFSSVQSLYLSFKKELDDPELKFSRLNEKFQTFLGVTYEQGNLENVMIPAETPEITTPWNAVNTALTNLAVVFYNAHAQLFYMQVLQLAFYYARNEFFQGDFLLANSAWVKGTEPSLGRKEDFEKAFDRLNDDFTDADHGMGAALKKIFGTETGQSVVKHQIPDLRDYIQAAINNKHTFPKELLETCAIKSVFMPALGGTEKQYFLGRIEMVALIDKGDGTEQITVGHDMPYASLPFGSKTAIGNTGIDGFEFVYKKEHSYLKPLKYSKETYKPWVPAFDKAKEAVPLLYRRTATGFGSAHQWQYFLPYNINLPKQLEVANEWLDQSKKENQYNRNQFGKVDNLNDCQVIKYPCNRSDDWQTWDHESTELRHCYIVQVKETGQLFMLVSYFPKQKYKSAGPAGVGYSQYVIPTPFRYAYGNTIKKEALNIKDPFKVATGGINHGSTRATFEKKGITLFENQQTGVQVKADLTLHDDKGFKSKSKDNKVKASEIRLEALNVPKNYLFHAGKEYQEWLERDRNMPAADLYLDGKVVLSRSNHEDKVILESANKKYRLIFGQSGEVQVLTVEEGSVVNLMERKGDQLAFSNGDIVLDGVRLIEKSYADQNKNLRWVSDPFARLQLTDEGEVRVLSSATPALGDKGIIWSSQWEKNNWPEIKN